MGLTNPGVIRLSGSDSTYSGTVRITGGPNITVGTDASGLSISGAAGGGGGFSAGASNLGNTAGATGVTGTRLVLVGTDNVTLSQTTDANGGTISISAAGGGAGQFSGGVSNLGNTAGSTGVSGTRMVLAAVRDMSLSQSTDANGNTISIIPPVHSGFGPQVGQMANAAVPNATLAVMYTQIPHNMTISTVFPMISGHTSAGSGSSAGLSWWVGVYTKNGNTLSLASSISSSSSWTSGTGAASNWDGVRGVRKWPIAATWSMTAGDYWPALIVRSTNAGSYSLMLAQGSGLLDYRGVAGVHSTVTTAGHISWGVGSLTASTTAFPNSIATSQLANAPSANFRLPAVWGTAL